jgi:hypothetical protein
LNGKEIIAARFFISLPFFYSLEILQINGILCLIGMGLEESGKPEDASEMFLKA